MEESVKKPVSSKKLSSWSNSGRSGWPSARLLWILILILISPGLGVGLTVAVHLIFDDPNFEGVETFSGLSQDHQEGLLTYPQTPPVGGVHNPAWQNCGIYEQPILNENAVHSLEHGAVWITYQPDLPAESAQELRELVSGRDFALLSPYPDLPAPVVASAWGVQLKVDSADDPRLATFLTRYRQGSQTPEPGAPCTGGVGTLLNR